MTTFTNVALSNTFNEFRLAHNDVANTLTDITTEKTTVSLYAGGVSSNSLSVSGSITTNALTSGRVVLAGTDGILQDDSGLTFNTTTNALSVTGTATSGNVSTGGTLSVTGTSALTGDVNVGGNNIKLTAANGSATFAGTTYATDVHGRQVHAVSTGLAFEYTNTWTTNRGEDAGQHLVLATGDTDGAHDMAVVNVSTSANAYAEFIAYAASGNSENGWVSMGVNSPNYSESAFSLTGPEDAYVLYEAKTGTTNGGNLIIGTGAQGTENRIILAAGGFDDPANNQQVIITPGERVYVNINTQSSNTTTGALVVNGGIGLQGNLNVGGNVAITGTITLGGGGGNTVSTSSLSVDNPIIFLAANNAADALDTAIVGEYTASGTKYNGLVRDASDSGKWKLFSGISNKPANTVNFTGATYDTLYLGKVEAVGAVAATNNTSGTIVVTGGVGVSGAIYGGGQLQTTGQIKTTATTASTSTSSGALVVDGGAGIAGELFVGGAANFAAKTTLANTTKLQQILEKTTVSATAAGSTVQFDVLTQGVLYYTSNASGNWTLNVRGSSGTSLNSTMATGEAMTIAFMATQGGTAYYASGFSIDGSSVTPKYQGGTSFSSGNANSIDVYTYTIVKTADATFTVIAAQTRFA
jgi:hypothetical protein